jgi:hypothetical protein
LKNKQTNRLSTKTPRCAPCLAQVTPPEQEEIASLLCALADFFFSSSSSSSSGPFISLFAQDKLSAIKTSIFWLRLQLSSRVSEREREKFKNKKFFLPSCDTHDERDVWNIIKVGRDTTASWCKREAKQSPLIAD